MEESCTNCFYNGELILLERDSEGRYLPNNHKKLRCCTVFAREKDGTSTVYGHTEEHDSFCEMYVKAENPEAEE